LHGRLARGPLQGQERDRHRRVPHRRSAGRVVGRPAARARPRRPPGVDRGDPAGGALAGERAVARPAAGAAGRPPGAGVSTRAYTLVLVSAIGALVLLGVAAALL